MLESKTKSPVDVEIFGPSFSNFVRSIMLLCEEHGISYQTGFELDGVAIPFKSEEHLKLHPYGKFPVIKHQSFVLKETATICRYLLNTFVANAHKALTNNELARIDEFSALTSIYLDKAIVRNYLLEFAFPKGEKGEVRIDIVKQEQKNVLKALEVIDNELTNEGVLGGNSLTTADVLLAPMLHYLSSLPKDFTLIEAYPRITLYLNRLMERESCRKVLISQP